MQCTTRAFTGNRRRRDLQVGAFSSFTFIAFGDLTMNTQATGLTVALDETPPTIASITPASASPILTETLVVAIGGGYDSADMDADEFYVSLIPQDGGDSRPLNVVEKDSSALELNVKYGGAYSGVYDLEVQSRDHGFFETTTVTFEAKIEVTDFNPKQGSKYGGTLVTITGGHFSDEITDNPVKIGHEWATGVDHYCYVQTSSDNEIVCRMATDYRREAGESDVIVFASTFEEATFADGVDRAFTFLDTGSIPTISALDVTFSTSDPDDMYYQLAIAASDITDASTAAMDVYIGGIKQEVLSYTTDSLDVKLIDINSGSATNAIEVYFLAGVPDGLNAAPFSDGLSFDPAFIKLSTNEGSAAGSTIYAVVEGQGVGDNLTLVDSTGSDICASASMVAYSLLECVTNADLTFTSEALRVQSADTGVTYACANTADAAQCEYSTLTADVAPAYSLVAVDTGKTTLTFTGTNLHLYGDAAGDCEVEVLGVMATSCSIDVSTGTTITAVFELGVPVTDTEVVPTVRLVDDCVGGADLCTAAGVMNKLVAAPPAAGITNALTITGDSATTLQCSFAGGCIQSIAAPGLKQSVMQGLAEINVCGRPCALDEALSDDTQVSCAVPYI